MIRYICVASILFFCCFVSAESFEASVSLAPIEGIETEPGVIKATVKEGEKPIEVEIKLNEASFEIDEDLDFLEVVSRGENSFLVSLNSDGLKSGVYTGSLQISNLEDKINVPVIFGIESKGLKYDATIDIEDNSLDTGIIADISLYNLDSSLGEAVVDYYLSDFRELKLHESEEINVIDKVTLRKNFDIDKEGDYVLYLFVSEKGDLKKGIESRYILISTHLLESPPEENSNLIYIVISFSMAVIFIVFLIVISMKKK